MSFQQGLSGLNTSAKQLDTIGNNVANASTVGFKQSRAEFADMYAAALGGGNAAQVGTGSKLAAVSQQFSQGSITSTSNPLDMAINGSGFYQMLDSAGSVFYSRNGQFQLDKEGFIVNSMGHKVNGYLAANGVLGAAQGALQIDTSDLKPLATDNIVLGANLDSRAFAPINPTFDISDPNSYNNSTSVTVYDSLGISHVASLYFQRVPINTVGNGSFGSATNVMTVDSTAGLAVGHTVTMNGTSYKVTSVVDGTTLTVSPSSAAADNGAVTTNAGSPVWNSYLAVDGSLVPATAPATALANLTFSTDGTLITSAAVSPATAGVGGRVVSDASFVPLGANPFPMTFDFSGVSQYGGNFGVSSLTQDGFASGRLSGFSTTPDGKINGRYSNGQSQVLGQIVLANFTNAQGLQPVGNNEWVETLDSGAPLIGAPGSANLGVIQSLAVEESNVDLTAELVNMITAQRVYQANAQTVKAQDQILQTIVNLR